MDKYVSVSMIIPLAKLLNQSMLGHLSVPLAAKLSSELSARLLRLKVLMSQQSQPYWILSLKSYHFPVLHL